ncbi:tRNA uridine-5-carboxymethylaminomethyl(34) synthesis GTPase MnmE [Rhodosalinus sp.]|uniref:tRNA uridine-5-carboxymethylaminomethyl(34) synthesis GTPase MnmE n=1 Tax=Rhodosalinus sp. TaxID=2047741 RepID=UPI00397E05CB
MAETIFALSSAPGKAGVAVLRLSGPRAFAATERCMGALPEPRRLVRRDLRDAGGELIDEAMVVLFPAPRSFTGEDVAEWHLHGSPAVVRAALARLSALDGLQAAGPGDFTRRALENDRLDLTQVEGLGDLLDAETEAQRRQAVRVLSGAMTQKVEQWRGQLLRAAALIEATIDFADEEVPEDVTDEVLQLMADVRESLEAEARGSRVAERIRDGFEVAIVGAPNAGKSTLLNMLAGRDAAITSEVAGTTRDVIEVRMDLAGLPVTLLDTAGLRETQDPVESIGVARARNRAAQADLRVWLKSTEEEGPLVELQADDIVVRSKVDLYGGEGVSGLTGAGIDALVDQIVDVLSNRAKLVQTATRARHLEAIRRASATLEAAVILVGRGPEAADLAAEEIRAAIRALEALVGRIDVEDVLGEIFASFCVGK